MDGESLAFGETETIAGGAAHILRTVGTAATDGRFTVTVRSVTVSAGAGFLVALTGDIMTMPGLPKSPAAERIDVDENGVITGMF